MKSIRLLILLTAFTGVFVGCGNKNASKPTGKPITLTINYSERESKGFSAETNLEMEVKIGDKTMPIKSSTTMDYTMNVDKVLENGDRLVSFKYDRIQSESGGMKWDSSNKNESLGGVMLGAQLSPLLEPTIRIKISRAGKSTILSGTEELPPTLKPQVEEAMRTASLASGFPDHPVDNGDTWKDKITQNQGGITVSIDTTYTLLDMSDGIATIEAEGKMSGSMKGKVNGLTKLNIATGWLIQSSSVAEGKSADAKMKVSGKLAKPIKGINEAEETITAEKEQAFNQMKEKARQGEFISQIDLAFMYYNGDGVRKNFAEAVKWFRKAVEHKEGEGTPERVLSYMYRDGEGVAQNKAEAVKWMRKAAERGLVNACFELSLMYSDGEGVTQDKAEALKWMRKGAERGDSKSQNNLGVKYALGEGVPQDFAKAAKWIRKAADQGDEYAQNSMGGMYERGEGVPKNKTEAAKWYRKAAEQGDADAKRWLEKNDK